MPCPDESLFVYRYLRDHLLSFVQNDVALPVTTRILRDALRGLAVSAWQRGIIHTNVKAEQHIVWTGRSKVVEANLGSGCGKVQRRTHRLQYTRRQTCSRLALWKVSLQLVDSRQLEV